MLSEGDRAWLEERFKSYQEDSIRQWQFMTKLNTELATHIAKSDGHHAAPCATALGLHAEHLKDKHNPKKTLAVIGLILSAAAALGEAIHYLRELLKK